jgi:hypothetical protein
MLSIKLRKERRKTMEKRRIVLVVISFLLISIWLFPSQAQAETRKYRIVMYFTRVEMSPIPALEGQAYMLTEFRGLTFWEDGEISAYSGAAIVEIYKGKGPVQNHVVHTFADGSTIVSKNRFINISAPDGKTSLYEDVTGEIVKGTGRFEGIKGTVTAKGKRFTPLSPGLKEMRGDAVVEGSMTFTLPTK